MAPGLVSLVARRATAAGPTGIHRVPRTRPTTYRTISPSAQTTAAGMNRIVSMSLNVKQMKEHVPSETKAAANTTHKIATIADQPISQARVSLARYGGLRG